jgi:L-cystine uptake protein TcyP (sodium:dicarboxylate symporter family)
MNKCRFLIKIQTHAKKFIAACQQSLLLPTAAVVLKLVFRESRAICQFLKEKLPFYSFYFTSRKSFSQCPVQDRA